MNLTHRFSIAAPLPQIWAAFNRIDVIAPCFPGATVTRVDNDKFAGSVSIKFGPTAMAYNGYGTYVKRDERHHRLVVEAKGLDRRGQGTGSAVVTATFRAGHGTTDVEVHTDLTITGKPSQFGDGVIADISDRLLAQFVSNFAVEVAEHGAHWADDAGAGGGAAGGGSLDGRVAAPVASVAANGAGGSAAAGAEPGAAAGGAGADTRTSSRAGVGTFTPPSNTGQPHLDVVRTLAPVALRRLGPVLGILVVITVILRRRNRRQH